MPQIVEKRIKSGICHVIHRIINNVLGCKQFIRMSYVRKITCWQFRIGRKHTKFDEKFMKNYDENSDKGYILEVNVEYPKEIQKTQKNKQ